VNPADPVRSDRSLADEARLVQQAKSGDADAFARLYDAYLPRVYRYVHFRVADDQTAEDLTAQVFLNAWEHLERFKAEAPFLAWLYTIARNQVIDHYRTRRPSVSLEQVAALPSGRRPVDEEVQAHFDEQAMREALQVLTEDQQQVLILRFIAELSTEEIAQMLHKRPGAVRALQMRGLQALEKSMRVDRPVERN
jgi:RNA polymerase sigma factor (sigma-70 family)